MNKINKYSHPHIYSLVYQPVSHTHTLTHIQLPLTTLTAIILVIYYRRCNY